MSSLDGDRIFFRSLATRGDREVPEALSTVIDIAKAAGFYLVVVETPGIGQGDAAIVPFVDVPMYVMTPEFGAASQLEKIDMIDFAELIVLSADDVEVHLIYSQAAQIVAQQEMGFKLASRPSEVEASR